MLADAVGVSFQQVQKYEEGTDRITASAPLRCAIILNAAVASVERGMGIVSWIILGLIAGFIGSKIVDRQGRGFWLTSPLESSALSSAAFSLICSVRPESQA